MAVVNIDEIELAALEYAVKKNLKEMTDKEYRLPIVEDFRDDWMKKFVTDVEMLVIAKQDLGSDEKWYELFKSDNLDEIIKDTIEDCVSRKMLNLYNEALDHCGIRDTIDLTVRNDFVEQLDLQCKEQFGGIDIPQFTKMFKLDHAEIDVQTCNDFMLEEMSIEKEQDERDI